jgi:hypothetical protein
VVLFVFLDFGTVPTMWTVGTVPKSRKTNNTTMLEQFQNLEKQIIPHCWNSFKILELFQQCGIICFTRFWNCSNSVVLFVFLDFGTVPTMWYYLLF